MWEKGVKEATVELKFWMRLTNEMAQSIRGCHNASYEQRRTKRAGGRKAGGVEECMWHDDSLLCGACCCNINKRAGRLCNMRASTLRVSYLM